ncbi:hypothetical protein A9Q84_12000 [Halobacteriovorax marinus]|uniref:Response regulatory domain-containing protein n=1 Tax=Halobacteriovorax marinus TaxID=97084 RepID=A0A1Y5F817_9BACT|nr:hypothetical protein A9Q84_12000 [Halobacteriovorax marinus]
MKILVLDDSEDNLNLIRLYTKKSDDDFSFSSSGDEALELIENQQFDLLFMDIQMPGMSGFEVLEKVRFLNFGKELFVCALTAFSFDSELEKIRSSSFNDYLQKPILRDQFLKYIGDLSLKDAS